jgi:hypothetical protein
MGQAIRRQSSAMLSQCFRSSSVLQVSACRRQSSARSRKCSAFEMGVRLNEHLEHPEGILVFAHACKLGLER